MLYCRKGGTDWTLPGLLAVSYCTLVGLGGLWLGVLIYPVLHYVGLMAAALVNTAAYPMARFGGMPWLTMSIVANWLPAAIACAIHASSGFGWALAAWLVAHRFSRFLGERAFAAICPERFNATAEYFRCGREMLEEADRRWLS